MHRFVPPFFLLVSLSISTASADWTATKVRELTGFQIPECVLIDPDNNTAYVSNVVAEVEGEGYERFWTKDLTGFISRTDLDSTDNAPTTLRWQTSTRTFPFNGPKGMCILDGWLWVTDIDRILRFRLDGSRRSEVINVPEAKALNDMATDGRAAYVTDISAGKCYRLRTDGQHEEIRSPKGINGITFHNGRMYAASLAQKDVYELDPSGAEPPRAFGLTAHFTTPDGIEILDDGTFIVSDSEGNQVVAITPNGRTARKIIDTAAPADIGLDRRNGLLYVPLFFEGRVEIYKLKHE